MQFIIHIISLFVFFELLLHLDFTAMSAMLKLSFVFFVLTIALFECFTTSTEAREVKNENGREANDRKWCIAKPSTSDAQLEMNVQYVCQQGYYKISCSVIQPGGSCYIPSNKVSSASMVMNLFFQQDGQTANACYFNGSGLLVYDNPTVGSCNYPPQ
ncbi:hypothetical protein ACLB2K_034637 [Fragaria x ananassa]